MLELYVKPLQFVMEQELLQKPLMLDVLDCKGVLICCNAIIIFIIYCLFYQTWLPVSFLSISP